MVRRFGFVASGAVPRAVRGSTGGSAVGRRKVFVLVSCLLLSIGQQMHLHVVVSSGPWQLVGRVSGSARAMAD